MLGGGVVRAVRLRRRSATRRAGCADCRPHCGSDGHANAAANGHADGDLYAYSLRNAYAYGAPYPYARADLNADADGPRARPFGVGECCPLGGEPS